MYKLDENQLRQILTTASDMGAQRALIRTGNEKTQINQAEAYRRYSRRRIDSWVKEGKIKPVKIKGSVLYHVLELEALSQTVDLCEKHLNQNNYAERQRQAGHPNMDVPQPHGTRDQENKGNRGRFGSLKRQAL